MSFHTGGTGRSGRSEAAPHRTLSADGKRRRRPQSTVERLSLSLLSPAHPAEWLIFRIEEQPMM